MLKRVASFILILLLSFFILTPALAYDYTAGLQKTGDAMGYDISGKSSVYAVVGTMIGIILSAVGLVFFALMVYGGVRWMIARSNEEYVTKAKNIIESAIIGLVIVVASYAITNFVINNVLLNLK